MQVTKELLYHLDISLEYMPKLEPYFYIPEQRVRLLRPGGFVYVVEKLRRPFKQICYEGILVSVTERDMVFRLRNGRETPPPHATVHVFDRPPKTKQMLAALALFTLGETAQN